jgi:predicted enzyme related to lactoylglutathione lyase
MTGALTFDAVAIDCSDPVALAGFWAEVLGTEIEGTGGDGPQYVDLKPVGGVPTLRLQRVAELKASKNRLHLDLMADDLEAAAARVESLGARRTGESHAEFGLDWIILQDPEGNEFCIIHEGRPAPVD